MQTTQLSESFNASLKGYLKSDLQLPEFFTHFVRMVFDKRYKELEAEYDLLFRIVHCKMEVTKDPRHCDAMDQSHVPSSQQSQVLMHSPMTVGNGRYMPMLFHPYNIHGHQLNMPSSQEFVQSNIMGFSFAQDPEKSNSEQSSTPRSNISTTFKGDNWSATPLHCVPEQRSSNTDINNLTYLCLGLKEMEFCLLAFLTSFL
ncbi:uncharacterized protein LOC109837545 isoform X2 [Asparagus officinalis]|uniref:uncharacterized protein LOC109837545 isoform X1 n=1 Tax=Asparagus officinalis TaxID=4686 RepID=UPI00098E4FC2|nr:uncharacterized protein LOC109837545 isoform X1 [Asparagus officinalis]XP_020261428.1 uncharacterized protein LOC109837545 isoform X2 [Asparagus officinalis]